MKLKVSSGLSWYPHVEVLLKCTILNDYMGALRS